MMPFLFQIPSSADALVYFGDKVPWRETCFCVHIASHDYKAYNSKWMDDDAFGNNVWRPDPDIAHESYFFKTEAEAIEFIRNWWRTH